MEPANYGPVQICMFKQMVMQFALQSVFAEHISMTDERTDRNNKNNIHRDTCLFT